MALTASRNAGVRYASLGQVLVIETVLVSLLRDSFVAAKSDHSNHSQPPTIPMNVMNGMIL